MNGRKLILFIGLFLLWAGEGGGATRRTYYVDAERGDDFADGRSGKTAWKSLQKVNQTLIPSGSSVLFRRGQVWRGQLIPQSGEKKGRETVYGDYGKGEKPCIINALDCSAPSDWEKIGPKRWATLSFNPRECGQIYDCVDASVNIYTQDMASVSSRRRKEGEEWFNRIVCERSGKKSYQIQLWGPQIPYIYPTMKLKVRMRSSHPFPIKTIMLKQRFPPWIEVAHGESVDGNSFSVDREWKTGEFILFKRSDAVNPSIYLPVGDVLPRGADVGLSILGLWRVDEGEGGCIPLDVGRIILDNGRCFGVKRRGMKELRSQLDFCYDPKYKRVVMVSPQNPVALFHAIDLVPDRPGIDRSFCHDIVFRNLAFRYSGGGELKGSISRNISAQNCSFQ